MKTPTWDLGSSCLYLWRSSMWLIKMCWRDIHNNKYNSATYSNQTYNTREECLEDCKKLTARLELYRQLHTHNINYNECGVVSIVPVEEK